MPQFANGWSANPRLIVIIIIRTLWRTLKQMWRRGHNLRCQGQGL